MCFIIIIIFFLMEGWYIFRYLLYLAIDEWLMFNGRLELVGINIKHRNHSNLDKCCRRPYGSAVFRLPRSRADPTHFSMIASWGEKPLCGG